MEFLLQLLAELFPTPVQGIEEPEIKPVIIESVPVSQIAQAEAKTAEDDLHGLFGLMQFH